ncbi:VOC family protein [Spirillospora sp. NPDC046719]
MPETNEAAIGRPAWLDLVSPDLDAARAFYGELFGWYVYTVAMPDWGDYHVFTLGDVNGPEVAGMQSLTEDSETASWTCSFCVGSVGDTMDEATAAGGQELIPPTDYSGLGRMALCSDPQGADFGLVQPGNYPTFGATGEPSTMCWVELVTPDVGPAHRFYEKVFPWQPVERDREGSPGADWTVDGEAIASLAREDGTGPAPQPAEWMPHLRVTDCDASAARAAESGGTVLAPPSDVRHGRRSVLADPAGARFAIMAPN